MAEMVSLDGIKKACDVLYSNPDIIQTPLLCHVQNMFPKIDQDVDLYLKLENMQTTGKIVKVFLFLFLTFFKHMMFKSNSL
jgi:hypothetical protein